MSASTYSTGESWRDLSSADASAMVRKARSTVISIALGMMGGERVAGLALVSCDQRVGTIIRMVGSVDNTGLAGPGKCYASSGYSGVSVGKVMWSHTSYSPTPHLLHQGSCGRHVNAGGQDTALHMRALAHLHALPENAVAGDGSGGQPTSCPEHRVGPQAHTRGEFDIRPQHHRGDKGHTRRCA